MRIILFANSIFKSNISHLINEHDVLVRFNLPSQLNLEYSGNRTDFLFIANTSELMEGLLKRDLFRQPVFLHHPKVIFPYSNQVIKGYKPSYLKRYVRFVKKFYNKKNYDNDRYRAILENSNIEIEVMPEHYFYELKALLDLDSNYIASTGIIALYYFLMNPKYSGYEIYLYGFEFKGWDGHPWQTEQKFVHDLLQQERIHLL